MTSQDRSKIIYTRLTAAFSPTQLEVIDDSDEHIGHAGHQGGGRHFTIIISAECFREKSRIESHRQIYSVFSDMIPDQIHALRIKII